MSSLFTSPARKATLLDWYERFAAKLTTPTTRRTVSTRFGEAHVLMTGPESAPPLVLLHGALASSAHLLGELEALAARFRVYAVDVVGQSVKSADAQPSVKNDDYGHWLADVMNALSLPRALIAGVSWGGFVAVRFAAIAPERVEKLVLLVPAGLVTGPLWAGFTRVAWPIMRYRQKPTPARLRAAMGGLLSTLDDDWMPYLGDALLAFTPNMSIPKLAKPAELAKLKAPCWSSAARATSASPARSSPSAPSSSSPGRSRSRCCRGASTVLRRRRSSARRWPAASATSWGREITSPGPWLSQAQRHVARRRSRAGAHRHHASRRGPLPRATQGDASARQARESLAAVRAGAGGDDG